MKPFKAIAAMSLNRVIGRGNQIPGIFPKTSNGFKRTTTGNVVIMGRRTFESIGHPCQIGDCRPQPIRFQLPRGFARCQAWRNPVPHETRQLFICGGATFTRKLCRYALIFT